MSTYLTQIDMNTSHTWPSVSHCARPGHTDFRCMGNSGFELACISDWKHSPATYSEDCSCKLEWFLQGSGSVFDGKAAWGTWLYDRGQHHGLVGFGLRPGLGARIVTMLQGTGYVRVKFIYIY